MLAFYLAVHEVENDRRALNVFFGMRRAKKEGRWVAIAPIGYKSRTTENGVKYIAPKPFKNTYEDQYYWKQKEKQADDHQDAGQQQHFPSFFDGFINRY